MSTVRESVQPVRFFKPIQDPLFKKFKHELKEISEQEPEKLVIEADQLKKTLTNGRNKKTIKR